MKIPLLQALNDVPIHAKTVRDLCVRKPGRNPRYPPTVYVIGKLSKLIMGKTLLDKYEDLGNPIITIHIGKIQILNVLVDSGAAINIVTIETV